MSSHAHFCAGSSRSFTLVLKAGVMGLASIMMAGSAQSLQAQQVQFVLPAPGVTAFDFGTPNVGSPSSTHTLTLNFVAAGPLAAGAVSVVTEGIVGADFKDVGTGTCDTPKTYAVGDTCTVDVELTPAVPGLRAGAVLIKDASTNVLATAFLHGIGLGPEAVFEPGTATTILTGLEGSGTMQGALPVIDVAGNIFIGYYKVPAAGGSNTVIQANLGYPTRAIDGAGNLYGIYEFFPTGRQRDTGYNEWLATTRWNGTSYADGYGPFSTFFFYFYSTEMGDFPIYADARGNIYQLNAGGITEVPWNGNGYDAALIVPAFPTDLIDETSDGRGSIYTLTPGNSILKIDRSHPPALNFASTQVGTTSLDSPKSFSVGNIGNEPLIFATPGMGINPSISANFALASSTTCPQIGSATPTASLNPGGNCSYAVKFIPTTLGTIMGALVITDDNLEATGAVQSAPLSGKGLAPPATLVFSPQLANFGNVGVGTTSQPIMVTVTNNSKGTASYVSSSNLSSFNIQGGTCGPIGPATKLAPGSSCTFSATFSPKAMGLVVGSFTLTTGGSTVAFPLKGNGVYARVMFSPATANFGDVGVGTTSQPLTITASNFTGSRVTYASSAGLDKFKFMGGTCGPINPSTSLPPDSSCTFKVTFTPSAPGHFKGSLTFNTANGPFTYSLVGNGVAATLVFSPPSANFGEVTIASTSAPITVTASNHTGSTVTFAGDSGLATFHIQGGTCGTIGPATSLPPNTKCTFQVTFSPTALVQSNGSFTLNSSAGPVTYNLAGTGVPATFTFSPAGVDFGTVPPGSTRSVVVTATNRYFVQADFSYPSAPFSATGCGFNLAPGSSCQLTITFTPTSTQSASDSVLAVLGDGAGPNPYVVLMLNGNP